MNVFPDFHYYCWCDARITVCYKIVGFLRWRCASLLLPFHRFLDGQTGAEGTVQVRRQNQGDWGLEIHVGNRLACDCDLRHTAFS